MGYTGPELVSFPSILPRLLKPVVPRPRSPETGSLWRVRYNSMFRTHSKRPTKGRQTMPSRKRTRRRNVSFGTRASHAHAHAHGEVILILFTSAKKSSSEMSGSSNDPCGSRCFPGSSASSRGSCDDEMPFPFSKGAGEETAA